jgi:FMN phosphatase YigB (HAD superfamily)
MGRRNAVGGVLLPIRAETGLAAEKIAYVGDRLDNDVLPAKAAGMFAVLVRRGPWGHLHAQRPEAAHADARIDTLAELTAAIGELGRQP